MKQKIFLVAVLATACGKKAETPVVAAKALEPTTVVALGRIEPEGKLVSLATEVGGIVRRTPIAEGQDVKKGEVLLELNHDLQTAKVAQYQSNRITQVSQLAVDQVALAKAEYQLANDHQTYLRLQTLVAQKAETQQALDDAETAWHQQEQELKRLKQVMNADENKLKEIDAQAAQAAAEVDQRKVLAPADGKLLRLDVVPGDAVATGATIGEFAPAGPITALCEVDELFATSVALHQKAYVRLQGKLDTLAVGEVSFVGPYLKKKSLFSEVAGDAEDRRVREVRITLRNAEKILFNTRVECVITLSTTR